MHPVAKARMPTSSVGNNPRRGFTLLELLVTLALAALLLAVVPQRLGVLMEAVRYRNAVQDTLRVLEQARLQAIQRGRRAYLQIDVDERRLLLAGQAVLTLDERIDLQVRAVTHPAGGMPTFFFDVDGSASGGQLILSDSGRSSRIAIDWLTGRITVERLTP